MLPGRRPAVHFVGIGGIGMSGLAELLLAAGFPVSGSDVKESAVTRRLAGLGARVFAGHRAGQVGDAEVVVVTSAARPDNPELAAARERGIPVIPRGELLAQLCRGRETIAVAGSHGKTTTSSLLAHLCLGGGLDPTVVVGGKLAALGTSARWGAGPCAVVEADESDGSFLRLAPSVAVITNVDPEHLDHYGSVERLEEAFVAFGDKVPFYGTALVCADHPGSARIAGRIRANVLRYGAGEGADVRAAEIASDGIGSTFRIVHRGEDLGRFRVPLLGLHNVLNGTAAVAAALAAGVPLERAREALGSFAGVDRRFTVLGVADGVTVVDDYGHHPAEIRATLAGARRARPGGRVLVAFQPHRYTRTRDLLDEFARCFGDADAVAVTEVYAASEEPIPGATGAALAEAIRRAGHPDVSFVPDKGDIAGWLAGRARPGDLAILQGAGDINAAGPELLAKLGGR
jgi:UDP-N-acetylmuramate--alanine ligase